MSIFRKVNVSADDSPSIDAFARWRVSNPETIFDSKQLYDNQPLFWDDQEVSGTGTSTLYTKAKASTVIAVSTNTAGKRVRQTFMRFNYQPGKSQLIFMTGTLSETGGGAGITRAMGAFDDDNGVFVKDDEGVLKFVIRSSTTGSPVDTEVAQADWNLDKLDGTGLSGKTLVSNKSQILIIDYEWLGVGRVRVGFVIDGLPIYCHEFLHANILQNVYMSTPNVPLRYEIENDGTGLASSLEHICTSVMSEGGLEANGILRHADTGSVGALASGTTYALLGIRLKSTHLSATILLEALSLLITSGNDNAHWELILNPTVAGTFTYTDQVNSAVQIAVGSPTNVVTGGIEIDGGYFSTNLPATETTPNALRLGSTISGTPDEIILAVRPVTNNITLQASQTWREVS